MSINVSWDTEISNIMIFELSRSWTWSDFFDALETAHSMLDNDPAPIGFIVYQPDDPIAIPQDAVSRFGELHANCPTNVAFLAIVPDAAAVRLFVDMILHAYADLNGAIRAVASVADAREIIREAL